MGLDLDVVGNLEFIKSGNELSNDEMDDMYDNYHYLYENDMAFNQSGGMKSGFYKGNNLSSNINISFSYGGYNQWRKILCNFSGFNNIEEIRRTVKIDEIIEPNYKQHKFVELCYFSDCEGFIGTKTCDKLYNDFKDNLKEYNKYISDKFKDDEEYLKYCKTKYKNMMKYFKIASENKGVVIFS